MRYGASDRGWLFLAALVFVASPAVGDERGFPRDFSVPPEVTGGFGGGVERAANDALRHVPVILVSEPGRSSHQWAGRDPGNAAPIEDVSVYGMLLDAGFLPLEVWAPEFGGEGDDLTSLEEATDDLKYFIAEVMRYTGANRVLLVAHGAGGLLARLTLRKYRISHWIEAEVYIATPFHGPGRASEVDIIREILLVGETLVIKVPGGGGLRRIPVLTVRNGLVGGDEELPDDPDSPALLGARNLDFPWLDHHGLRSSRAVWREVLPFLLIPTEPRKPRDDRDGDGFCGSLHGGPDLRDDDPTIFPGAREIPDGAHDQDCNRCWYFPQLARDGEVPFQ